MAGLYISEERGILLRAALELLPKKYRLSHIPFRVNTRKGEHSGVVYGTVVFRGMERAWEYPELVSLEIQVSITPAFYQPPCYGLDAGEERIEMEFTSRLIKVTVKKSQGGAWLE